MMRNLGFGSAMEVDEAGDESVSESESEMETDSVEGDKSGAGDDREYSADASWLL